MPRKAPGTRGYEELLDGLATRIDDTAAETARAIRDSIPAYARAWDDVGAGVEGVVRMTLLRLVDAWRTGQQPSQEDFSFLGRMGVPPVESGITLSEVLHAYRISGAIIIGALSEASRAEPRIDPQRLLDATLIGFYYLNDLSLAVTREGVEREHARVQRRGDAERALVAALVARPPRIDEANRLGRTLGIHALTGPWMAIVGSPREGDEHPTHRFAEVADRLRHAVSAAGGSAHIIATIDDRVVVLTRPLRDDASLEGVEGIVVGIGGEHPGPGAVGEAYDEATVALDVALRNGLSSARFDRIRLDRVLIGSLSPAELAEDVLQPLHDLPEAKRREWESTLDTYLEAERNVTETARRLHVHPHTVRYRIGQIERRIGDVLDSHDDRLVLSLALRARRLARQVEMGPPAPRLQQNPPTS